MKKPLVSIIVPVYNVEQYLSRCIESIIYQSYSNIEIILVDDGSRDNSGTICDKYAFVDKRVKVIHKVNGGQSTARNAGLDIAKGDLITFVDSDDFISQDYILSMYETMDKFSCDIVQCDYETGAGDSFKKDVKEFCIKIISNIEALSGFSYKVVVWGKLYKRDIIGETRFPVGKINEDDATYYIFAYNAKKIALSNEILYYYFMSENSTMRNRNHNIKLDFIEIYNNRIQFFYNNKKQYLVDKSYERFAIVLILTYSSLIGDFKQSNSSHIILNNFKNIYQIVRKSNNIKWKYKAVFNAFYLSPIFIGKIIRLIKKS